MVNRQVRKELSKLKRESEEIRRQLKRMPKGKLRIKTSGNITKWYRENSNGLKYLKKKYKDLAQGLAQRMYLEYRLADIKNEIKALSFYTRHHNSGLGKADSFLLKDAYRPLVEPLLKKPAEAARAWASQPYERNPYNKGELPYKSTAGTWHASKGEAMIASALYNCGIAFICEPPFRCANGKIKYPDFIIYHPRTGELYLWEHMGMMDIDEYRVANLQKIVDYGNSGYLINDKLIVTMESDTLHLDMEDIMEIINRVFLD